jgi:spore maturation protein CgeB
MENDSTRSILIAGPSFRAIPKSLEVSFKSLGFRVSTLEWRQPPPNRIDELRLLLSKKAFCKMQELQMSQNALMLERGVTELKPDVILVLKHARITRRTRDICGDHNSKLFLWAYDSVRHIPEIAECAKDFDIVFTYEPNDLAPLSKMAPTKFLPMAYDSHLYYPIVQQGTKSADVLFVGALAGYHNRRKLLELLADKLRNRQLRIWTDSARMYSLNRISDLLIIAGRSNTELRWQTISHETVNRLYNDARICLNIHHSQSMRAVNPRNFEILGSGGFLLTDREFMCVDGITRGEHYVTYSTIGELLDMIEYFIENEDERENLSKRGHQAVQREHTYLHRARRIAYEAIRI